MGLAKPSRNLPGHISRRKCYYGSCQSRWMIHYQREPRLSKPLVEAGILSGKDWAPIAWGDNQNPPRNGCCFLDKDQENRKV